MLPMASAAPIVATTTLPRTAGVLPLGNTGGMLASEPMLNSGLRQHNTTRDVPLAARDGALGTTAATMPHKPTMGQKLKGAVKQLQGTVTGNELKKEEGKLISAGVDPLAARAATTPGAAAPSTTLL
jgi:hypothetical protein